MKRLLIAIVALSLIINVPQKANAIVPIVLLLSGLFTLITLPLVVVAGKKPKRVVEKIPEIETVRGMETGKAGNETPTYTQNEPAEELDEENRKTPLKKKKEKTVSEPTYLRNEPAEELDEENRKTPLKKKKEDPTSRPQGTTGRRQGLSEERMLELKLLFERLDVDNTRDVQFCKQIASLFKAEIASRKATRDQEENVLALYYGRICNRIKELLEEEQQGEEKKQGEEEKQETPQNFSESYWMQFLKFLFKFL
jgi:hypothetical protein